MREIVNSFEHSKQPLRTEVSIEAASILVQFHSPKTTIEDSIEGGEAHCERTNSYDLITKLK